MRYFLVSNTSGPVAVLGHDYRKGTHVCRSVLESFALVFDACVEKQQVKYNREGGSLRIVSYSPQEYEWIDDVISDIVGCGSSWSIEELPESSGSDITLEDIVTEHLT